PPISAAEDPRETLLRNDLIHGEVHDGNAFALGGAAGHAGLFGTAAEIARLAREFLVGGRGGGSAEGEGRGEGCLGGSGGGVGRGGGAGTGHGGGNRGGADGDRVGLFSDETLLLFRENFTPGLEEGRSFGWKLAVRGCRE